MAKFWKLNVKAIYREVGPNIFIISFENHANKQRVESGQPWLFDNHFFAIDKFDSFT